MSFTAVRHALFTVHMWVGLILGILLAALGLSGSLLVYDEAISDWISPPPHATTAGQPLPLSMITGIARDAATEQGLEIGGMQILVPQKSGEVIVVRFNGVSPMGAAPAQGGRARPRGLQMYIEPVSGEVLGSRGFAQAGLLTFMHQLHGNFLMSRELGRPIVGWLGVAMCLLGLSGLVLWWPKRGQWQYAFKVRRTASGLRFHRELHAATGIWIFLVFMAVSFSGVVIAWPGTMGLNSGAMAPRPVPRIEAGPGKRLGATEAVIAATAMVPNLQLRSIAIPRRADQPYIVNYLSHGAVSANMLFDPYRNKIIGMRDNSEHFLAWMRPVHDGTLNSVWRFLVFLSGLVPSLFIVTGLIMWWKKRQRRVPMSAMTDDLTAEEAAA
jgi:uncharacterized iron-regulated membrane protein